RGLGPLRRRACRRPGAVRHRAQSRVGRRGRTGARRSSHGRDRAQVLRRRGARRVRRRRPRRPAARVLRAVDAVRSMAQGRRWGAFASAAGDIGVVSALAARRRWLRGSRGRSRRRPHTCGGDAGRHAVDCVLLSPVKPPYDALEWERMPFAEKSRLVCLAWAMQGYGTPLAVYAAYALKVVLYCGGWVFFCTLTPGLGGLGDIAS